MLEGPDFGVLADELSEFGGVGICSRLGGLSIEMCLDLRGVKALWWLLFEVNLGLGVGRSFSSQYRVSSKDFIALEMPRHRSSTHLQKLCIS